MRTWFAVLALGVGGTGSKYERDCDPLVVVLTLADAAVGLPKVKAGAACDAMVVANKPRDPSVLVDPKRPPPDAFSVVFPKRNP